MPKEDKELSHCGPIAILLAEDNPQVRKLLHQLITTYDDLSVVGEAANGEEAVLLAAALKPAVVVMDVRLPVLSGRAATTLIRATNPFTAIIGVTAGGPQEDEKAMVTAGAATVINKSDLFHALRPAIVDAFKRIIKKPVVY
jgi:DNA-binding NarL/FixJ family response regulator